MNLELRELKMAIIYNYRRNQATFKSNVSIILILETTWHRNTEKIPTQNNIKFTIHKVLVMRIRI